VSARDAELDPAPEPSLVRPYALVGGRTRRGAAKPLPVETVIVADLAVDASGLQLEPAAIVRLCHRAHSVAEISARLSLPVGVVRVLVADLAADGHVTVNLPLDPRADGTSDRVLLERVLAGLEAL
jgi:hypothetical protein